MDPMLYYISPPALSPFFRMLSHQNCFSMFPLISSTWIVGLHVPSCWAPCGDLSFEVKSFYIAENSDASLFFALDFGGLIYIYINISIHKILRGTSSCQLGSPENELLENEIPALGFPPLFRFYDGFLEVHFRLHLGVSFT